jgi:hypothetical protein
MLNGRAFWYSQGMKAVLLVSFVGIYSSRTETSLSILARSNSVTMCEELSCDHLLISALQEEYGNAAITLPSVKTLAKNAT